MLTLDSWTDGNDNWDTPGDWSDGLPGPSSYVEIDQGNPEVTASFGTVGAIETFGGLTFIDAGASSVSSGVQVDNGTLGLDTSSGDGGSTVATGSLWSDARIQIGPSDGTLSAASVLRAGDISNDGTIDLIGGGTIHATLSSTGALTNRSDIALFNGASVTTAGDLTNQFFNANHYGTIAVYGGSSMTIGGTLTNEGTIQIGPSDNSLSAASTVKATSFNNDSGAIDLYGSSTAQATLKVASAAGFGEAGVLYGDVNLSGSALLEFASGQITTIAAYGELSLGGAHAFVADASNTSSNGALKGLTTIDGSLSLSDGASVTTSGALTDGGAITLGASASLSTAGALSIVSGGTLTNDGTVQIGPTSPSLSAGSTVKANGLNLLNGANMTTSGALTNSTTIALEAASGNGSLLAVGGTLTNDGTITIGPSDHTLSAASSINAASLANHVGAAPGTISLYGSSTAEATLDVGSAAGFGAAGTLYGEVNLYGGDALIEFASGQITTIAAGSQLLLFGPHAFVADASDTSANSALKGLQTVGGLFVLHDGASVTTTGAVSNSGTMALDRLSHDGGSSLTIGGALTNDGTVRIGPNDGTLSAASSIKAASLANHVGATPGTISLYGSSTREATLDVGSAAGFGAAGTLYGEVDLYGGDTLIEFASGQITTMAAGSQLLLFGPHAFVADASDTSSNSALMGLHTVGGLFVLHDGALVTTTGAVSNSGTIALDRISTEGGSSLTIGGTLTNDGTVRIGPSDGTLSAASSIKAASLANQIGATPGTISLYGSSTAEATLDVGSAADFGAAGTLYGEVNLYGGDALIEFASGQITTIAADSQLLLFGPHAFVADASDTSANSALVGLHTVGGLFVLHDGASVTTTGAVTVSGTMALDRISTDGGSSLTIGGTLTNDGTVRIGPSDGTLSATSVLTAASIVNDGIINLAGDGAAYAILNSPGAFTNGGSVNVSDDVETLAGAIGGTGKFNLSNNSTLEFGARVSSGQTVNFAGGADTLILDSASSFHGAIDGFFTSGDAVVANTFAEAATLLSYTQTGADSCSWTLTDGANTAVLNFAGEAYTKSDFSIVPANGGAGLAIKFV